jgi:hypothetical protein
MTARGSQLHRSLLVGLAVGFAAALVSSADAQTPAPVKSKPATPPPKKRAEREADEAEGPDNEGNPNAEESYYVAQTLFGTWKTAGEDGAGPRELTIKLRGLYTITGSVKDSGFMMAQVGRYSRRSDANTKSWAQGTFNFLGINKLETTGPLGTCTWERVK